MKLTSFVSVLSPFSGTTPSAPTAVGQIVSVPWDVAASPNVVGQSVALPWDVRSTVNKTGSLGWNALTSVSKTGALSWNTLHGLDSVWATIQMRWSTAGLNSSGGRVVRVQNISKQIIPIMYGPATGDTADDLCGTDGGIAVLQPGRSVEIEEGRIQDGQLEQLARLRVVTVRRRRTNAVR